MTEDIYSVSKISEYTYKIDEMGRDLSYLLLGEERALLIDCSLGVGNIKGVVESITDLPITVVATHAHADHTGGASQFKSIYIHKEDCRFIFKITNSRIYKTTLLSNRMKKAGVGFKNFKGFFFKSKWIPFEDGYSFDLGKRTVTAVHTPGHSVGSCIFLDDKEELMFTGDNTLPYLLMNIKPCVSLSKWLDGAEKTYYLCDEYTPLCSHGDGSQTKEQIGNTILLVRKIISRFSENSIKSKVHKYYSEDKKICVVFDENNIY